ncbi:4'-phosphopantetheinyl transferase superfamily protein [Vibrio sp. S4M6]|uniref:4'-phosphopantetheinyl transferase family protein n=1 Tax=Vibrio sinus TaxID=2946865 RepID=UPI00202A3FA8|nr:4'-phosphopantetheinyl transferase superfamily protein [Vibrio sinus]MCL9781785.1 4'-phosphopantetheinyl transferase superfamily protein [Vibrio sinus]
MDRFFYESGPVFYFETPEISVYHTSFDVGCFSEKLISDLNRDYFGFVKNAVIKRKSEFVAGRYCAHQSLALIGGDSSFINVGEGRCPMWPSGFLGSISHCDSYALAASAKSADLFALGLDVENIVDDNMRSNLLTSIVNQDEMFLLEESITPNAIFTLIFSMKESFFKAVYPHVKTYFDFSAISILQVDQHLGRLEFRVNDTVGSIFTAGAVFSGQFKFIDNRKVITFFQLKNQRISSSASQAVSDRYGEAF